MMTIVGISGSVRRGSIAEDAAVKESVAKFIAGFVAHVRGR